MAGSVYNLLFPLLVVLTIAGFVAAIMRDRRIALLLIPPAVSITATIVACTLFYGKLSIDEASEAFNILSAGPIPLIVWMVYLCRRRWRVAILLGLADIVVAVCAAAVGAMALADSWL